jgi:hypothetical protein
MLLVTPSALNTAALVLPWVALSIHIAVIGQKRILLSACLAAVGMYVLILWAVQIVDAEIAARLSTFDLDHDGGFSGNEITPAFEVAMADFTNDTGRAMAPFTGAVFSLVYSALVLGIWSTGMRIFRRQFQNRI